jgi:hypothetical protein
MREKSLSGVPIRWPHIFNNRVIGDKISIYVVKMNFSNIVSFKGVIRKILNMAAVLIFFCENAPLSCQQISTNACEQMH